MEEVLPDDYEKQHVHDVYDEIADQFSQTRYKVWTSVESFIARMLSNKKSADVIEVGCGNGKNLVHIKENFKSANIIGCDTCDKFVDITRQNGVKCVKGNVLQIPFDDLKFDVVLSVAVLHHLSTDRRRRDGIKEMFRVLRRGGFLFIQVWAFNQPIESKRQFNGNQDQLVGWNNQHDRYYHLFKEGELEQLVNNCLEPSTFIVDDTFYEQGNWCIILNKK